MDLTLLAQCTRVVVAFTEQDGRGDAFRYPETSKHKRSLADIHEINLRHLREEMGRACTTLTQIEGILDYGQDWHQSASEHSIQLGRENY